MPDDPRHGTDDPPRPGGTPGWSARGDGASAVPGAAGADDRTRSFADGITPDPAAPSGNGAVPTERSSTASRPAAEARAPAPGGRRRRPRRGRRRATKKAPWWELPLLVVIAVAVAVLIKTFLVQPFYIPSESMESTLHGCAGCSGDRILVNKPIYRLRDPHPGDIVVFRAPSDQWFNEPLPGAPGNPVGKGLRWFGQLIGLIPPNEHDLVKRVIATGGQTIKCCDADGNIEVSASGPGGPFHILHEPYVSAPLSGAEASFGPVTVPAGRLWVMGDNRAHSEDSRWHYQNDYKGDAVASTVPVGNVIGKAVIIAWPPSRWRTLGTPSTFTSARALPSVGPPGAGIVSGVGVAAVAVPVMVRRRRRR